MPRSALAASDLEGPLVTPAPASGAAQVLIIDADPAALDASALHMLRQNGMHLQHAASAAAAEQMTAAGAYNLAILELDAATYDGFELCRAILEHGRTPLLVWSRIASPLDQVAALELGAEDFVPKTAHPLELLARCRAILRRARAAEADRPLDAEPRGAYSWEFDPQANSVASWRGSRVWLRPACATLLGALCDAPRTVVNREALHQAIAGGDRSIALRTVDALISRLRRGLDGCDGAGRMIRTVQAQGYFLNAEAQLMERGYLIRGDVPRD